MPLGSQAKLLRVLQERTICRKCFRRTSRQGSRTQPVKLLLSGPWPPYNFVDSNPGSAIL
jgi:hypothetical protein